MKDIEIVNIDYSGVDPAYRVKEKHVIADMSIPWLVPDQGPFFTSALRLLNGGTPLFYGVDYVYDTPAPELSSKLGKDVYHFIELKDHVVANATAIDIEYQRVGEPMIGKNQLLKLLEDMFIKGEPIDFTTSVIGIPKTFPSAKHSMDVTKEEEVVGFGNFVQLFAILTGRLKVTGEQVKVLLKALEDNAFAKLDYIQNLQWGAIMHHATKLKNPHGVVAADVELNNLANNATATTQQELEGTRSDLYSTPKGLGEIVKNAEPDSEEFVFQNELPFSYYGSGIYLPPPISGSFEGLGGDMEVGSFIQEGNGWLVGLVRKYDGRVRNLYYIYDQVLPDDPGFGNWIESYVQYKHPSITAVGSNANCIINGSCHDIAIIGDNVTNRWWLTDPNSTFDPTQHVMKEIDMSVFNNRGNYLEYFHACGNVMRIGDWVYFILFNGEDPYGGVPGVNLENSSGWFYRVPLADLYDPAKPTIRFQALNISHDNLRYERRNNVGSFVLDRVEKLPDGRITTFNGCRFTVPCSIVMSHRRRQVFCYTNPDNKNEAIIRMQWLVWCSYSKGSESSSVELSFIADFRFNTSTNLLTLKPGWKYMDFDVEQRRITNLDLAEHRKQVASITGTVRIGFCQASTRPQASKIPGFGMVGYGSWGDGAPPYVVYKILDNPSRDPRRDWEYAQGDPTFPYMGRPGNDGVAMLSPVPPFGFTSFPRWTTDLYHYNGSTKATPVELFMANNPGKDAMHFYREVEPGTGADYIKRNNITLLDGTKPLAREMNTKFGVTNLWSHEIGRVNNPRSKDKYSTEYGLMTVFWLNKPSNPLPVFTQTIKADGSVVRPSPDAGGGVNVPLICEHTISEGVMTVKSTPAGSGYLQADTWRDMPARLLGAEFPNVIDMILDFYICAKDDNENKRRPSYYVLSFHTTDRPKETRVIIGQFTWRKGALRPDGTPTIAISSVTYPFTSDFTGALLAPGANNVFMPAGTDLQYNSNGTWRIIGAAVLSSPNQQVLEYPENGPDHYHSLCNTGWRWQTTGYSRVMMFEQAFNPTVANVAPHVWTVHTGAFVSYSAYRIANPQHGMSWGINYATSGGGAINLTTAGSGEKILWTATFSVGNWDVFINSDVPVTFNGYSMVATKRNFDLREYTDQYRSTTFYIYVVARGSKAEYEITKTLRYQRADCLLMCKVTTNEQGIVTIERYQPFAISGAPFTQIRDAGTPATSGGFFEEGVWRILKQSDLYTD